MHGWTTSTASNPYDETYTYDAIGNLLVKAGVSYAYGANGNGSGPHQVHTVDGQSYTSDANGNLVSGGGRLPELLHAQWVGGGNARMQRARHERDLPPWRPPWQHQRGDNSSGVVLITPLHARPMADIISSQ